MNTHINIFTLLNIITIIGKNMIYTLPLESILITLQFFIFFFLANTLYFCPVFWLIFCVNLQSPRNTVYWGQNEESETIDQNFIYRRPL